MKPVALDAGPQPPPGYPAQLVQTTSLADGTTVIVRPILPSDLALETNFVGTLSGESGYQRLMSARRPPPEELWRYTHIDYVHELAMVALASVGGQAAIIAVARFVRDATGQVADFAIVVADAWQGRGLGSQLMRSLIDAAGLLGAKRLTGITMTTNARMLALAKRLGFEVSRDPQDATVSNLCLLL